ncbi:MAG: CAP domain-containing protein [Solirubrobacterales bacterium]
MGPRLRKLLTVLLAGALLALGATTTAAAHPLTHAHPLHHRRCNAPSHTANHTANHAGRHNGRHNAGRAARRCRRPAHGTQAYRRRGHHPKPQRRRAARSAPASSSGEADAAVIARVLATPCRDTEVRPEAGNAQALAAATLCLVNQVRARNGELPLALNAQLEEAALEHSREMVSEDYFAHVSPSGETPLQRVRATGYVPNDQVGYTIGENIAWGTLQLSTPSAIVAAWVASPEHLANMLDRDYRDTGMGVAPAAPPSLSGGNAGAVYTQEFGVIVE